MNVRDALLRGKRRPRNLGGGSPTVYRGDGYEFVELRQYVPGDDVRRIDWAATARANALQTRVVLEDVALTLGCILDESASMRVGRARPLLEAAREAQAAWFGVCRAEDRAVRALDDGIVPARGERGRLSALVASAARRDGFDLDASLATARAALPRGTALLAIGDWFDLDARHDGALIDLAGRFDCTALVARDPWYDGMPLRGLVRLRGAEGGSARVYVGKRERAAYAAAVRERERMVLDRFERAGWRTGLLHEHDGAQSLARAFGVAEP
jgi:uncharacterized protein (DUF58 family)